MEGMEEEEAISSGAMSSNDLAGNEEGESQEAGPSHYEEGSNTDSKKAAITFVILVILSAQHFVNLPL